MTKRPSLASLAPSKANTSRPLNITEEREDADPAPAPARAPSAAPYKAILSKVDDRTHKQLKRLAVDEGKPVGDLQIEALNLLFKSRGLDQIAIRVTPDERRR